MLKFAAEVWSALIIHAVLGTSIGALIQGATSFGVYEVLQGNAAWFGKSLSHMVRILPTILGVFLTVIFVRMIIELGLSGRAVLGMAEITSDEALILAAAIMVIAIWLLCRWCAIVPVCVVERLGPIETLRRAAELTKGCFWKIACLYLLAGIISAVFNGGVGFALRLLPGASANELNIIFFEHFTAGIPTTFGNIMVVVIYYELRKAREGVSIDSLASVFD